MSEMLDPGMPEGMEVNRDPRYLQIRRRWYHPLYWFLAVFALFWNLFLVGFYSNMGSDAPLMAKLFPLLHVGVGIGISYYALAGFLNRTDIFVSLATIEIKHSPLPWPGKLRLKATDLKQLYSKEKVRHHRNSTSVSYEVHALNKSGSSKKLLSGLDSSEQALFIESEIEKYLKIKDQPVKGAIQ